MRHIRYSFLHTSLIAITVLAFIASPRFDFARAKTSQKHLAEVRTRAEHGFVDEQLELAAAYVSGRGVDQDMSLAAHWYQKAAQSGNPVAQNLMGYFYQKGIGVRADFDSAVRWYQLSASSGFTLAKVNLGVLYLHGDGVHKNIAMARTLFMEALERGEGLAAAYLGNMEYFGLDGPADKQAAERWFERGFKLHDGLSAYDLACVYMSDTHGQDLRRGAELLRFASDQGYVPAKYSLGVLLLRQPEFAAFPSESRDILEVASRAGNWGASMLLGVMARDGSFMGAEPGRAYYFFRLAELQGGPEAQQKVKVDLAALERTLPQAEQLTRSNEAEAWMRSHPVPLSYVLTDSKLAQRFPLGTVAERPHENTGE